MGINRGNSGNLSHFEQTAAGSISFVLISDTLGNFDAGDYFLPALKDLDGDGLLDLIVGEMDGTLNHLEQDPENPNEFNLMNGSGTQVISPGSENYEYALYTNYPNPFNTATNIQY